MAAQARFSGFKVQIRDKIFPKTYFFNFEISALKAVGKLRGFAIRKNLKFDIHVTCLNNSYHHTYEANI